MARILITGSSDGIGLRTAQRLVQQGHKVVLHARNEKRAEDARQACQGAEAVLVGDLTSLSQTTSLAHSAISSGPFDTVIHNAALGFSSSSSSSSSSTTDNLSPIFQVNTLAPYLLTSLLIHPTRPKTLIYLTSNLASNGSPSLLDAEKPGKESMQAYCDSKLQDLWLARAVARRWDRSRCKSVAVDPGWVRTKMGGKGAPGGVEVPAQTLARMAAGEGWGREEGKGEEGGLQTGMYYGPEGKPKRPLEVVEEEEKQEELLSLCARLSGVVFPD